METNPKKDRLPDKPKFPSSDKARLLKNLKPGDFAFKKHPEIPADQNAIKKDEKEGPWDTK
jgi:hypothetical protein